MNHTEVLDRIGGLLLLPNTELATTKQVAEFYGVPINTIYSMIHDNREELEKNGMKGMTYKELKELIFNPSQKKGLENLQFNYLTEVQQSSHLEQSF